MGAQVTEAAEGAVKLAGEAGLVAVQEAEGAGVVEGELAEAGGGAESAIEAFDAVFDVGVHVGHLFIHDRALHVPGARETPAADGHLLDEQGLGGGDGAELIGEGFVHDDELGAVLDVEAGEFGGDVGVGQAVAECVASAAGLAFGGGGAAGFGAVGAGGGALGLGAGRRGVGG